MCEQRKGEGEQVELGLGGVVGAGSRSKRRSYYFEDWNKKLWVIWVLLSCKSVAK